MTMAYYYVYTSSKHLDILLYIVKHNKCIIFIGLGYSMLRGIFLTYKCHVMLPTLYFDSFVVIIEK